VTAEVLAGGGTLILAGALATGDRLWLDDTQAWHTITVLPSNPVMLPTPDGRVLAVNLHLTPPHPVRWIAYPIPLTTQVRVERAALARAEG
jgi:hypothetical protein